MELFFVAVIIYLSMFLLRHFYNPEGALPRLFTAFGVELFSAASLIFAPELTSHLI
jgi:hypothetical protein